MQVYDIWIEGYAATGNQGRAEYLGLYPGLSFKDACRRAIIDHDWKLNSYNEKNNTYWSCRFFDNETDARRGYG